MQVPIIWMVSSSYFQIMKSSRFPKTSHLGPLKTIDLNKQIYVWYHRLMYVGLVLVIFFIKGLDLSDLWQD